MPYFLAFSRVHRDHDLIFENLTLDPREFATREQAQAALEELPLAPAEPAFHGHGCGPLYRSSRQQVQRRLTRSCRLKSSAAPRTDV